MRFNKEELLLLKRALRCLHEEESKDACRSMYPMNVKELLYLELHQKINNMLEEV